MTRTKWMALALGIGALASGAAALAGASNANQTTCAPSDVPCRLTQIEASLGRIERAVGSVSAPVGAAQVSMAVGEMCTGDDYCRRRAVALCQAAGFARGVPSDLQLQPGYTSYYRLAQVTCLD